MTNYDVFKNAVILESATKTGYNLVGQIVYNMEGKKAYEDKLEVLFNRMRILLNQNDAVSN
jgi:hypothetical protein